MAAPNKDIPVFLGGDSTALFVHHMRHLDTLKKNYEFQRLYSKGKSAVTPFLVVYARRGGGERGRVGFTVSNKLGKAVTRNRVRRRLREIYRLRAGHLVPGTRMVIVARGRAVTAAYGQLDRAFLSACRRLGLTREDQA